MMHAIEVALGILQQQKQILLLRQQHDLPSPWFWSLPGGKLEPGETIEQALHRELLEETGLQINSISPFIEIPWQYPQRNVHLHVFLIHQWLNPEHSNFMPDNKMRWWHTNELEDACMPAANNAIKDALKLPAFMAVTPLITAAETDHFIETSKKCMRSGLKLIYLRGAGMSTKVYANLLQKLLALAERYGTSILRDARHGIDRSRPYHIPGTIMDSSITRGDTLCSASCHNIEEADRAKAHGVNMLLASPVRHTSSHPERTALGWKEFKKIATGCGIPTYALGGMGHADLHAAWQHGARGIALHSKLWQAANPEEVIKRCVTTATARGDIYP